MKALFFPIIFLMFTGATISQNLETVTVDGRKIILNPDNTWKYDRTGFGFQSLGDCILPVDYREPVLKSELQNRLSVIGLTIHDLKKQVAKENDISFKDVHITGVTEGKEGEEYRLCVKGSEMVYLRTNLFFHKRGEYHLAFH